MLAIAWWRGAGPERAMATAFVTAICADVAFHLIAGVPGVRLVSTDIFHAGIDVFMLVAFVLIAVHANRSYTLWIAALQTVATLAHLARGLFDPIAPIAYAILFMGPSYFQIILLAGGIALHIRRQARHGSYRSWRTSFIPSPAMPRRS